MSDNKKPRSTTSVGDALRKSGAFGMKSKDFDPSVVVAPVDTHSREIMEISDRIAQQSHRKENPAGWMRARLMNAIHDFEARLDPTQEIGGRIASGLGERTFHIGDIDYSNPDMLIFKGVDGDDNPVQLVQHHSQLSVMLIALKSRHAEPRRIGFTVEHKE